MSSTTFSNKLAESGAQLGVFAGAETPSVFSDSSREFEALRKRCGVIDFAWRSKLVVSGEDRTRWLNGMVTNNTRDLPLNHGNYNFVLNPQGRIQGDLVAYNRGDYYLIASDVEQVVKIREFFERHIIMDDVELSDISDKLHGIAVAGPAARELLSRTGMDLPELEPYEVHDFVWKDVGLSVARGPAVSQSFELWMHPDNAARVWDALVGAGATPAGTQAMDWLRISLGIPRYGIDISDRDLPQETGQQHALHFAKGCYVGQEIVERIRSRGNVHRMFSGFRVQGPPPLKGSKIEVSGKEAGEITSAASIPFGEGDVTLALGYIRREAVSPETNVKINESNAQVSLLPFSL